MSCITLTDEVCLASLVQLSTSLAIDNLFPILRGTPLQVPVPPIPPSPSEPTFGGLVRASELGVSALLPSEMGGDGGVWCRWDRGDGDPSVAVCTWAALSLRIVNSSFNSRNSSFNRWFSIRKVSDDATSAWSRATSSVDLSYFCCKSSNEDLTTLRVSKALNKHVHRHTDHYVPCHHLTSPSPLIYSVLTSALLLRHRFPSASHL